MRPVIWATPLRKRAEALKTPFSPTFPLNVVLNRGAYKSRTSCCREVDPTTTENRLAHAADQVILVHEPPAGTVPPPASGTQLAAENAGATLAPSAEPTTDEPTPVADDFGTGIAESD